MRINTSKYMTTKAKVVLTIRDFDSWYKSCQDTIFRMIPNSPYCPAGIRAAITSLGFPHSGFAGKICWGVIRIIFCFGRIIAQKSSTSTASFSLLLSS